MSLLNLDFLAAKYSQDIVEGLTKTEAENMVNVTTKSLGVLQEQGVYALILFLFTTGEQKIAKRIREQLLTLLKELPGLVQSDKIPTSDTSNEIVLKFFSEYILEDLDTLFLIRDLYEQTLIYTRYGAKAVAKGTGSGRERLSENRG